MSIETRGDMLDNTDRERLLDVLRKIKRPLVTWEDRALGPWAFEVRNGEVHVGVSAFLDFQRYLAGKGVNVKDRMVTRATFN